jgi:hypothetical protein
LVRFDNSIFIFSKLFGFTKQLNFAMLEYSELAMIAE